MRQGVEVRGQTHDVVAVSHGGLQLYSVDPATRQLSSISEGAAIATSGEGLCLYVSAATRRLYALRVTIAGVDLAAPARTLTRPCAPRVAPEPPTGRSLERF